MSLWWCHRCEVGGDADGSCWLCGGQLVAEHPLTRRPTLLVGEWGMSSAGTGWLPSTGVLEEPG